MLPEGWKNVGLAKLADKISDGIHTTPEYTDETGLYFINGNNIKNGQISIGSSTKSVSQSEFKKHKKDLNDRTLLISINGTIGNIAYYNNEPVILGKSAAYVNVKSEISKDYVYHFLSSEITQKYFTNELTGSTIRNLSLGTIKQTPTPVPPLSEQRRIAEILSTWDRAIAVQERLVANARAQKKALMQQLLTGKKRLPGFKGEWKKAKLRNICTITYGASPKGIETSVGKNPIIGTSGVVGWTNRELDQGPAIIIGRKGTIDNPFLVSGPFWAIDTAFFCKPINDIDLHWLFFSVCGLDFKTLNEASGVPSLSRENLYSVSVLVPPSDEQEIIGRIVVEANKFILGEETKIVNLKQEKSALMQQLLTGKRRVKVEAGA